MACQKCRSAIPDDATRCSECGYEPSKEGKLAVTIFILLGAILTMTGVGAIVGIPMIAVGLYSESKITKRRPSTHPQ